MTASALKPVQASERSAILDLLRGFALFGILLDNIFGFTGYSFFTDDMKKALPTSGR